MAYKPLSYSIYGQTYVFRIEDGGDQRFSGYRWIKSTKTQYNVRRIMSARGGQKYEAEVLRINGISSAFKKLALHTPLRIPDKLRTSEWFGVLAGDTGPQIRAGYARIEVVGRAERAGMSVFTGYDPVIMEVPIRFEAEPGHDGEDIEADIAKLERMAGRGNFAGAAQGAPPRISVTTVTKGRDTINLIPGNYQWTPNNESAPIWWISDISWDGEPWRDEKGNRIRQLCAVSLTQFVRPDLISGASGATERNAAQTRPAGVGRADPDRPNIATGRGSGVGVAP